MLTAAWTEVVSAVLDRKELCIDDESGKTTDEVGVYYLQTDSWVGFFFARRNRSCCHFCL